MTPPDSVILSFAFCTTESGVSDGYVMMTCFFTSTARPVETSVKAAMMYAKSFILSGMCGMCAIVIELVRNCQFDGS